MSNDKHINTAQFAERLHRSPQTIRAIHSKDGIVFGIRPKKVGRFLLWPLSDVEALLAMGNDTSGSCAK